MTLLRKRLFLLFLSLWLEGRSEAWFHTRKEEKEGDEG